MFKPLTIGYYKQVRNNPRCLADIDVDTYLLPGMAIMVDESTKKVALPVDNATTTETKLCSWIVSNIIDKPEIRNKGDYKIFKDEYVRADYLGDAEELLVELSQDVIEDDCNDIKIKESLIAKTNGKWEVLRDPPEPIAYDSTIFTAGDYNISVLKGAGKDKAIESLPTRVGIKGKQGEENTEVVGWANIKWTIDTYTDTDTTENTFAGALTLPDGWIDEGESLVPIAAKVTVVEIADEGQFVYKETASFETGAFDITVPFETSLADVINMLPRNIGIEDTTEGTANKGFATIEWVADDYNSVVAGKYNFAGVLSLPSGWDLATGADDKPVPIDDIEAEITVSAEVPITDHEDLDDYAVALQVIEKSSFNGKGVVAKVRVFG